MSTVPGEVIPPCPVTFLFDPFALHYTGANKDVRENQSYFQCIWDVHFYVSLLFPRLKSHAYRVFFRFKKYKVSAKIIKFSINGHFIADHKLIITNIH